MRETETEQKPLTLTHTRIADSASVTVRYGTYPGINGKSLFGKGIYHQRHIEWAAIDTRRVSRLRAYSVGENHDSLRIVRKPIPVVQVGVCVCVLCFVGVLVALGYRLVPAVSTILSRNLVDAIDLFLRGKIIAGDFDPDGLAKQFACFERHGVLVLVVLVVLVLVLVLVLVVRVRVRVRVALQFCDPTPISIPNPVLRVDDGKALGSCRSE